MPEHSLRVCGTAYDVVLAVAIHVEHVHLGAVRSEVCRYELIRRAAEDIAACTSEVRAPKLVVRVEVEAAYLHCAKAFLRSRLWEPDAKVDRAALPTAGRMISDQTGIHVAPETREEMVRRYQPDL